MASQLSIEQVGYENLCGPQRGGEAPATLPFSGEGTPSLATAGRT